MKEIQDMTKTAGDKDVTGSRSVLKSIFPNGKELFQQILHGFVRNHLFLESVGSCFGGFDATNHFAICASFTFLE